MFQGEFQANDAVLRLSFASYEPDATAFRVELGFVALLEFLDQDGDGRYGLSDTEVRRFPLENQPEWTITEDSAPADAHAAVARLPLDAGEAQGGILDPEPPPPPGLLTLRFVVGGRDRSEAGQLLAPTDVVLGLQVERFPFAANESRLALETRVESSVGVRPTVDGLEGAEGPHGWTLRWATTAELDGQTDPVHVNVLADPRLRDSDDLDRTVTVAYGYGQADLLVYDPVLGVSRVPTSAEPVLVPAAPPGHVGLYTVGALGAGLIIGGTAWSRVRRRAW